MVSKVMGCDRERARYCCASQRIVGLIHSDRRTSKSATSTSNCKMSAHYPKTEHWPAKIERREHLKFLKGMGIGHLPLRGAAIAERGGGAN
jgi:hypothetical protein